MPNYIELLLGARNLDAIRHGMFQPSHRSYRRHRRGTLLYLLLRHSMLLEYAARRFPAADESRSAAARATARA